jgi:hypothetical protein
MIVRVEIEGHTFTYLYLKTWHAEEQQLERGISDVEIEAALRNPAPAANRRGRWEYTGTSVLVIVEDDERGYFDGIIVTVFRV